MQQQTTKKKEEEKNTVSFASLFSCVGCVVYYYYYYHYYCICCSIFVRLRHANSLPGDLWVREHDNEQADDPSGRAAFFIYFFEQAGDCVFAWITWYYLPYETGRTVPINNTDTFLSLCRLLVCLPGPFVHVAVEVRLSTHS